jgi:hypothetical protein
MFQNLVLFFNVINYINYKCALDNILIPMPFGIIPKDNWIQNEKKIIKKKSYQPDLGPPTHPPYVNYLPT